MDYILILIWKVLLSTGVLYHPPSPENAFAPIPFEVATISESSIITNNSIITNIISTNTPVTTNIFTNISIVNLTTSYVSIVRWDLTNMAMPDITTFTMNDQTSAVAACNIAWDNEWQTNKSASLKAIENMYITFLTNDWTKALRQYTIISNDATITVDNTSESSNIQYLMIMRVVDTSTNKVTYNFMASEFTRYKDMITQLGGVMSKVQTH